MAHWLSFHTSYACRHAGACCSSGWPIPLERDRVPSIAQAIAAGQIAVEEPWLLPVVNQPAEVAGLLAESDGRCVFHQSHRCSIQSALGHDLIPIACQHFPRVCLIDDRGVSVTLSHYCPTAASLLVSYEGPVTIVDGPEPVPGGTPEGLDARGSWPPLLAPTMLMDLAAYAQWEVHLISWLGGDRNPDGQWPPDDVLHLLELQARRLASWRPGEQTLEAAIHDLASDIATAASRPPDWALEQRLRTVALDALAPSQAWDGEVEDLPHVWSRDVADAWRSHAPIVNRLLAAHAFAAWGAYQADGIVAGVRQLQLTLAVLRNEAARVTQREGELSRDRLLQAIRRTDLLLVHLVNRSALSSQLARVT